MKPKIGDEIKFWFFSDWTGGNCRGVGTVLGFGEAVREKWPKEMGEAPDNVLLVKRIDTWEQTHHHAVNLDEIDEIVGKGKT